MRLFLAFQRFIPSTEWIPDARQLMAALLLWLAVMPSVAAQNQNNFPITTGGTGTPKNLGQTIYADQFHQADWCANVKAADTYIGAGIPGEIFVNDNAGGPACAQGFTLGTQHFLKFINGQSYSLGINTITMSTDSGIYCDPGTEIIYTGTGVAIDINTVTRPLIEGCYIDLGTSSTAIGISIRNTGNTFETKAHIKNVEFAAGSLVSGQIGLRIRADNASSAPYHNDIDDTNCELVDRCIYLDSLVSNQGPNGNTFRGVKTNGSTSGVYMPDGSDNSFLGVSCLNGSGTGSPICINIPASTNLYATHNNHFIVGSELGTGSTTISIASGVGTTSLNCQNTFAGWTNDATQITDNSGCPSGGLGPNSYYLATQVRGLRAANNICAMFSRNAANNADVCLALLDASNVLGLGGASGAKMNGPLNMNSQNLSNALIISGNFFTGITNSGTGLKHARVTTGSIGATSRAEVLISWAGTAFADTSYTVACSVEDSTTAAASQGLVGERVRTKSATQVGFVVSNPTAGALTGTLDCTAMHD